MLKIVQVLRVISMEKNVLDALELIANSNNQQIHAQYVQKELIISLQSETVFQRAIDQLMFKYLSYKFN